MSEMWVERHRPQTVADIKGQKAVVDRLVAYSQKQTFPHLLFAGPPGTGKTTAALALTRDVFGESYRMNLLEMNASDERKLESIRTKVKGFAKPEPASAKPTKCGALARNKHFRPKNNVTTWTTIVMGPSMRNV